MTGSVWVLPVGMWLSWGSTVEQLGRVFLGLLSWGWDVEVLSVGCIGWGFGGGGGGGGVEMAGTDIVAGGGLRMLRELCLYHGG